MDAKLSECLGGCWMRDDSHIMSAAFSVLLKQCGLCTRCKLPVKCKLAANSQHIACI